ncbi:NACHT domain-containing protein [Kocuria salsicia]|uniref:NACHT domain-containing protein n=2 Tax=Kocuria TaxID=57493 RepID=UPI0011A10E7D|nr:NACHT domain-containing protein [Kocuria salsicia]
MLDGIFLSIGLKAATHSLKAAIGDENFSAFVDDSSKRVGESSQQYLERRKRRRTVNELAQDTADKLAAQLEIEWPNVPQAEVAGVVDEIEGIIPPYKEMIRMAVRAEFDDDKFYSHFADYTPEWRKQSQDTENQRLFEFILYRVGQVYLRLVESFPETQHEVNKQSLMQESEILSQILQLREIIEDLHTDDSRRGWASTNTNDKFRIRYLETIDRNSRKLEIYGLEGSSTKSRDLSMAYISLSIDQNSQYEKPDRIFEDVDEGVADTANPVSQGTTTTTSDIKIESALAGNSRLLIVGNAGLGKTTILQWISYQAAGNRFAGGLDSWNQCVPFLIRLRKFADGAFPDPSKFVEVSTPIIASQCPSGWVEELLDNGQAIVLVDGLDELPISIRSRALSWFEELTETFPNARYVVTSRPNEKVEEWKKIRGFRAAELAPMSRNDIASFIAHWHDSLHYEFRDMENIKQINYYASRLQTSVENSPELKQLCSTPLLCGLICALHYNGHGHLPTDKMDLYQTAIKMLVSTRDQHRDIRMHVNPTWNELNEYLKRVALWMHENELASVKSTDLEARIAIIQRTLGDASTNPKDLVIFFQERSGVLRQPVIGEVDFVHKSFLEYLAASSIIETDEIPKLIANSSKENWSEVIRWAAGHGNSIQRGNLINGLIDKADAEPQYKYRLYILAVSCRNMARRRQIPREIVARVNECLTQVIPPQNMTHAAEVALAGDVAVDLLKKQATVPKQSRESAASVRALSLIGSEQSMLAIRNFARDTRITVNREVYRAWSNFDSQIYAADVLSNAVFRLTNLAVSDPMQLMCLPQLPQIESVSVSLGPAFYGVSMPEELPTVRYVESESRQWPESIQDLSAFQNVKSLCIRNSTKLSSLDGIEDFQDLHELTINSCELLSDISAIRRIPESLQNLALTGVRAVDFSALSHRRLKYLLLDSISERSIGPDELVVDNLSLDIECYGLNLAKWFGNSQISRLTLRSFPWRESPAQIVLPLGVSHLNLSSILPKFVEGANNVRSLSIWFVGRDPQIQESWLAGLSNFPELEDLDIRSSKIPENISDIGLMTCANQISLSWFYGVKVNGGAPPAIAGFELSTEDRYRVIYTRSQSL